jgi:hypothetical protein
MPVIVCLVTLGASPATAFLDPPTIEQAPMHSLPALSDPPAALQAPPIPDVTASPIPPPLPPLRPRAERRAATAKATTTRSTTRARVERRAFEVAAAPPAINMRCTGLCGRFILIGVGF